MNCPHCKEVELIPVMTKNGVLVDFCPQCEGIWLDKGEIFYFTKIPTYFKYEIEEALKNKVYTCLYKPFTPKKVLHLIQSAIVKRK